LTKSWIARLGVALMALWAGSTVANAEPPMAPVVVTDAGRLRGSDADGVWRFLGIPYAAPPVGGLRWKPPATTKPWSGVREATAFGAKCMQPPARDRPTEGAEDCLYLNVYAPDKDVSHGRRPVLVWFHPGSMTSGSGQDVDGHDYALRNDQVVVTVNYRLGVFGFLALPELDREDPRGVSGNYGILDQQAALRWVQRNIAAFGGDPTKVTIAGQSAGSFSSFMQILSPAAAGLFRGAITMSAPIVVSSAPDYPGDQTLQSEEREGPSSRLAAEAGCAEAKDRLECLRTLSTEQIAVALRPYGADIPWSARIDGVVLPGAPSRLVMTGEFNHVPLLNGSTNHEGGMNITRRYAAGLGPMTVKAYRDAVLAQAHGLRSIQEFPPTPDQSLDELSVQEFTSEFACDILRTGEYFSKYVPVYEYLFADPDAPPPPGTDISRYNPGAYHTSDIQYVFAERYPNSRYPGKPDFTPAQRQLSDEMMADWGAFVRDGRPASAGWSELARSGAARLLRSDTPGATITRTALRNTFKCNYWDSIQAIP
jgi:para-nitrobenzyl esterase